MPFDQIIPLIIRNFKRRSIKVDSNPASTLAAATAIESLLRICAPEIAKAD
jgi:hypothetical protein